MKKGKKLLPLLVLLLMAAITLWIVKTKQKTSTTTVSVAKQPSIATANDPASSTERNRSGTTAKGLHRNPDNLKLSQHALCRMRCRHIDEAEIRAVLQSGTINYKHSDVQASPDPKYAVEGSTKDGQQVRVIIAQNSRTSTVVTVIDTRTKWECNCPGD
jgi:Domain of unknown function (DUF4258)